MIMDAISTGIQDTYYSIEAPSSGIYRDLGSKFLAFAYPVSTEDEAKAIIASVKKEYFDARHHCFAWRIGYDGAKWRVNDDGEPSSTAGRPILGQILSNSLSDILIVVVRYFGGTKLGVPGLIKAYKSASADALASAVRVTKVACADYRVSFAYESMNQVMKVVKDMGLQVSGQQFEAECSLHVRVPLSLRADFERNIGRLCIDINYFAL